MKLTELVPEQGIVVPLRATDRDSVVSELAGAILGEDRPDLVSSVLEREQRGTTGFGRGVAVPHVKHPGIDHIQAAVGLSQEGVDFASLDGQPVHLVFLLLSPEDRPEDHLQAMELVFKHLSRESFRSSLREAESAQGVRALLEEADVASVEA